MSNYGLFVKGKMLGARQRNKVNGQGYYNEIGIGLEIPDGLVVQSRIKLLFEFLRLSLTQV